MKLDIEALGKEAGGTTVDHDDPQCWIGQLAFNKAELEAFASLIVERCAVEAWNHTMDTCTKNGVRVIDNYKFCCAAAIRQLLEDR